jgi:hypothetical protein
MIGAHTPEFPFEKAVKNVRRAAKSMTIDYPIAVDSDYAIWQCFQEQLLAGALFRVDPNGGIRHHHFGETKYDQSERIIQQLLADTKTDVGRELVMRSRGQI